MELITGKNRKEFRKWYESHRMNFDGIYLVPYEVFMAYHINLQSGVITAYYDSVNVRTDVKSRWTETKEGEPMLIYEAYFLGEIHSPWLSRPDAQKEAFKQADILRNK